MVAVVRRTVGHEATLLVDGNDGYHPRPMAAAEFALATAGEDVFAMEEMFDEELVAVSRDVKRRLRVAGLAVKLADGETHPGGIPGALLAERCVGPGELDEPLFDIDQPDMNTTGYIRLLAVAKTCAEQGTTIAPHNFGSKLGFYAQVHAGLVTPNWELSEADDSMFTALRADGFQVEDGRAKLTGMHGLGVALEEEHLGELVFDLTGPCRGRPAPATQARAPLPRSPGPPRGGRPGEPAAHPRAAACCARRLGRQPYPRLRSCSCPEPCQAVRRSG